MSIIVVRHVNNLQGKIVLFTSELKGRRWRNRLECQAEKLVNWYFNWLTDRYRLKDLASSWIMDQLLYSQSFSALRLSDDLQITLHRQQIPNPNTLSKSRKHENLEYVIEGLSLSFCNECEEKNWKFFIFLNSSAFVWVKFDIIPSISDIPHREKNGFCTSIFKILNIFL